MKRVQTKWENVKRHERLGWKERIIEMVIDGDCEREQACEGEFEILKK